MKLDVVENQRRVTRSSSVKKLEGPTKKKTTTPTKLSKANKKKKAKVIQLKCSESGELSRQIKTGKKLRSNQKKVKEEGI